MARNPFWLIGALVLAVFMAVIGTTPPPPTTPNNQANMPSSQRAMAHVRAIAAEPHSTGTAANKRVREYLVAQLTAMGLEVQTEGAILGKAAQERLDYMRGAPATAPTPFVNIIATLKGVHPELEAIGLMAHHDTVWGSPGAADDSAGVASLLETVRAIKAQGQPKRDVILIITDAEELGLVGAKYFFANNPIAGRIGALINLEARGGGGIASMFQTAPGNAEAVALYARSVQHPATSSLSAYLYSILPNDTDLTPALERGGFIAYNIAFIGRSSLYHSPLATPENLDGGSLNHMLLQTHALTNTLAEADHLPQATSDVVFFDFFGLATFVYPPWLGWVMLAIAVVGFAAAYRKRDLAQGEGGAVGGAVRMTGTILALGAVLYGANLLSGAGTGAGYYDRLAAIPKLMLMASFAAIGVTALLWGAREWRLDARLGAAIPLLLVAVCGQALAPTAAYFVVIAVMLVAFAEASIALVPRGVAKIVAALVAAIVTGYMLVLGWLIMQGVGPSMPFAVALPLALALLSWLPLWPGAAYARWLAALMAIGVIGTALWVRFDAVPPSVAVYSPLKPG